MNLNQKPELKQIASALNICEWIQFMKDECNSLEEEKKFLTTQFIALITTIVILIWLLIQLSISQISFNLDSPDIFYFKAVFASLIIVSCFQIYRILELLYVIKYDEHILRIFNVPKTKTGYLNFIPIIIIFSIVLYQRLSPLVFSGYTIPVEVLNSVSYWILLIFFAMDTISVFLVIFFERRFSEIFEKNQIDEKKFKKLLLGGGVYQFVLLISIISILNDLNWPPYELLEIQIKFGLVIVFIFFILIYLIKPFYYRLEEIAIRIKQLNGLIDKALRGDITKPEDIISQRDKLKIY